MKRLSEALLDAEPLELRAALRRDAPGGELLRALADFPFADASLLDHAGRAMELLLEDPPPGAASGAEPTTTPWWSPMPDAYAAALLLHVGLPAVSRLPRRDARRMPPHARHSARLAREFLRELGGIPFQMREHAAALVAHQGAPISLVARGAPGEATLRLSCRLDLRALYHVLRADLRAAGDGRRLEWLEAFRERAEGLGVFGLPCEPAPAARQDAAQLFPDSRERHRALNAARYFRLVAGMHEPDWFRERLRQERASACGRLHLLIGPAGSGKSSWARHSLGETTIVSSDRMREEVTGDPSDQGRNYLVFQLCMDRVRGALRQGREVTFDATNYSEALRSMPVQAGRWCGAEIISYFFDLGLSEALARNVKRRRIVPEHVIRRHFRLLETPALYEADRHVVVDAAGQGSPYWPAQ